MGIPEWLKTAPDRDKESFIHLADIAEPNLFRGIGRPQIYGGEPPIIEHPWFARKPVFDKHVGPMRWPVREREGRGGLSRAASLPFFGQPTPVPANPEIPDFE